LADLGPEPLDVDFNGDYLYAMSRTRKVAVKPFLMNARVVVGVGNIYASEALFRAGIKPSRKAGTVTRPGYARLAECVRDVLGEAIAVGGTTIRDFADSDGRPGYFSQQLNVYGRNGEPCPLCEKPIRLTRLGQRSTYYCPHCQK
jgi:formamidopyrimidine-DNA glycosylase